LILHNQASNCQSSAYFDTGGMQVKRQKFVNADDTLAQGRFITRVQLENMKIALPYQDMWLEQLKFHVRNKLDD